MAFLIIFQLSHTIQFCLCFLEDKKKAFIGIQTNSHDSLNSSDSLSSPGVKNLSIVRKYSYNQVFNEGMETDNWLLSWICSHSLQRIFWNKFSLSDEMVQKNKHLHNPYTGNYIQNIFKVKNGGCPFGASAKI